MGIATDYNPPCPECGTFPMTRRPSGFLSCPGCGKVVVPPRIMGAGHDLSEDQQLAAEPTMVGDEIVVPDFSEVRIGWRAWGVETPEPGEPPLLRSVTYATGSEGIWAPREPKEAECSSRTHRPGQIPLEGCTCGLYSAKSEQHLKNMTYHKYDAEGLGLFHVIGTVKVWGKVIEGTQGWRAQYGYPQELFLPFEAWQLAKPLTEAYGVPVHLNNILKKRQTKEVN